MSCEHGDYTLYECRICHSVYMTCDTCSELIVPCGCVPLKMFQDDNDTIIAHSVEEAMQIWNETYGDDYEADLYRTTSSWTEIPSNRLVNIRLFTDDGLPYPESSKIIEIGTDDILVCATAQQWIDCIGKPAYLCSKEW